jgi:hypothetical protein
MLPLRVPSAALPGERPMVVSMHLPSLTAASDEPLPKWQVMRREPLTGSPAPPAPAGNEPVRRAVKSVAAQVYFS